MRIIATSDVHAYLDQGLGQLFDSDLESSSDLLIDNGDFFTGSPLASYYARHYDQSPLVEIANQLAYDAMVIGNHDLDYGLAWLKKQVAGFNMPYLAANVFDRSGQAIFQPFLIKDVQGCKIAIIGVLNSESRQTMPVKHAQDVLIFDPLPVVKQWVEKLAEKVDVILVAYHGGLIKDMVHSRLWTYPNQADQSHEFLETIPQIKGLICGHQHFSYGEMLPTGQAIIQPSCYGRDYGELILSDQGQWLDAKIHPLSPLLWEYPERLAFQSWFDAPADYQAGLQALSQLFPSQAFYWPEQVGTWAELWQAIPQPFSLASYLLKPEEMDRFLGTRAQDILPALAKQTENQAFELLTLAGSLPSQYCRREWIFPLFDFLVNPNLY